MRILLAEDHSETADFVLQGLTEAGQHPVLASNGLAALELGLGEAFDLFILDRMMPGLDGLTVLRRLREAGRDGPAIILTALGQIEDRVEGLDAGADDYLTKPFAMSELIARINALMRRGAKGQPSTRLSAGPLALDLLARTVTRDGEAILLQPKEVRLLEELIRAEGEFVTRTMLLERVWNFHFDPQTKIVETHVSRLRSKLNEGGKSDLIENRRGVGYRLVVA